MNKHSTTPGYVGGLVTGHIHPSQAHWPTERREVIKAAWRSYGGAFPHHQLPSGVMFYMGERVTAADFDAETLAAKKRGEKDCNGL